MIQAAERGASQDFVLHSLTVPSLCAAYAAPMVAVDIGGLGVHYAKLSSDDGERSPLCRTPIVKKPRGRPQTARRTAGEQGARLAGLVGVVWVSDCV